MKGLITTKMAKDTLIHDHVMKMIGYINELDKLGVKIDDNSKIDVILSSLPNL